MVRNGKRLKIVGDRILVKPAEGEEKTDHGLYLPKSAVDKNPVQWGKVVACGPGIPLPSASSLEDESWKATEQEPKYFPLQAKVGDEALFLRKAAIELQFEGEDYLVVSHNAILVLVDAVAASVELLED